MQILCRIAMAAALLAFLAKASPVQEQPPSVPAIDGKAGPCSADFLVRDAEKKPLYDAKIQILLMHGFAGMRRLDLQVGTNGDGKARFEGLPQRPRLPVAFEIRHGEKKKSAPYTPATQCKAAHEITLE